MSRYTRDAVLSEVVGMANASGGVVILGIEETEDDPPRAQAPYPLRDCAQLADRFGDMAWSCIDPRLPSLEVKGVPLQGDGSGVVLFRVLTSLRGPHGLTTTRRAYIRRGSKTETMYVREIQERTLQTQRGLDWIERRLGGRQLEFAEWCRSPTRENPAGMRATVLPGAQVVAVDAPYANSALSWPNPTRYDGSVNGQEVTFAIRPSYSGANRPIPILRGARREIYSSLYDNAYVQQEVHWDGLCDVWVRIDAVQHPFYPNNVLWPAIEALRLGDEARRAGGAPGVELLVEVAVTSESKFVEVEPILDMKRGRVRSPLVLPRVTVIGDDFQGALKVILDDLLNATGNPKAEEFSINLW